MSKGRRLPFRAHLLVGDERHEALECSVAGVSLAGSACHSFALGRMQRGEDGPATLVLSGPSREEVYAVTIRLAARGPAHVEFAFVTLPPPARYVLEELGPIRAPDQPLYEGRREETPEAGPRRLVLSLSATVAEITKRRRSLDTSAASSQSAPSEATASDEVPVSIGALLLAMLVLIALAALCGMLLFR